MDKEKLRRDFWNEKVSRSQTRYDELNEAVDYFMKLDIDFYKFSNLLLASSDCFRSWDPDKVEHDHDAMGYFIGMVGKSLFYDCRTEIIKSKNHDYMQGQKDYYLKHVLERAAGYVRSFDVTEPFTEKFESLNECEIHAVIALATIMGWKCTYDKNKPYTHTLDKHDTISFKRTSMPYFVGKLVYDSLEDVSMNIKPEYNSFKFKVSNLCQNDLNGEKIGFNIKYQNFRESDKIIHSHSGLVAEKDNANWYSEEKEITI